MRATLTGLAALVLLGLGAAAVRADYYFRPVSYPGPGYTGVLRAPEPFPALGGYCHPGSPGYLSLPFQPYQGPAASPGFGPFGGFKTHPYLRSPRDFFMVD